MDFANNGGSGFTVTPSVSYNEAGEEIVSYDDASVVNEDYKQQIIAEFNNDNTNFISEDSAGNAYHAYELDEEQSMRYSEDWVEDVDYEDFAAPISDEDEQMIVDQVGGHEEYYQMMDWAAENCHPDDIDWFDAVVSQGNVEDILQAVENLHGIYAEAMYGEPTDDLDPVTEELQYLSEAEPEGLETAYEQLERADAYNDIDPAASIVLQASAAFHRGDLTADQAIGWVFDTVGEEAAVDAYQRLI